MRKTNKYFQIIARCGIAIVIFAMVGSVVFLMGAYQPDKPISEWNKLKSQLASSGIDTSDLSGEVMDVDSSHGMKKYGSLQIDDPYSTLRGCLIFALRTISDASVDTNAMLVVMKGGKILWMSDRFNGQFGGNIIGTMDLNKDGTVDIVSEWISGSRQDQRQLWIYSWDGTHGKVISSHEGGTSDLEALSFDFDEIDSGRPIEIVGQTGEYDPTSGAYVEQGQVTYTWNGDQYGDWGKN